MKVKKATEAYKSYVEKYAAAKTEFEHRMSETAQVWLRINFINNCMCRGGLLSPLMYLWDLFYIVLICISRHFQSRTRAMEFSNTKTLYWCILIWSTDTCTNTFFPCGHTCSASYCHYLVSTHFLVFFLIFSLNLLKPNCQSERSVNSKSGIRPSFIHMQSHTQAYSLSLCLCVYNRAS